jgi:hypothetical protein
MKKITLLIALTLAFTTTTSHANSRLQNQSTTIPSLAVIDTAIDTSLPDLSGRIVHEVCILQSPGCPNGGTFQEGPGSATLPLNRLTADGFDHGTQMAWTAATTNKNMNIVFIRIVNQHPNGTRMRGEMNANAVALGLQWVIENSKKWNIQAVSMSQAHHNLLSVSNYCYENNSTLSKDTPFVESKIKSLEALGVPVFLPAGNNADTKISWPACIPSAMSIGATLPNTKMAATYSNFDAKLLDFFAPVPLRVVTAGNKVISAGGTSISTQVAAANWIALRSAKPTLTYSQVYDLLVKTGTSTSNSRIKSNRVINLTGAING